MAIISITERNYKTVKSTDKKFEFQVEYIVVTDSSTGPEEIRNLPEFKVGREYNFGADSNANANLKSVTISRMEEDSRTHWLVMCNFSTDTRAKPGEGGDPGGRDDPFKPPKDKKPSITNSRDETFEIRFSSKSEPMYGAIWLGTGKFKDPEIAGEDSGCCPWVKDESIASPSPKYPASSYAGPIINSSGQPLENPPQVVTSLPVVRYVVYYPKSTELYVELIELVGKVNSDEVEVKDLDGNKVLTAPAGTLKCLTASAEATPQWEDFVWVNYEFEYDQCGHSELVPDKGRMLFMGFDKISTEGTDDGTRADIVKVDDVEVARDEVGDPVEEEIWLDGKGKKLPASASLLPYFSKWFPAGCYITAFADKRPFVFIDGEE